MYTTEDNNRPRRPMFDQFAAGGNGPREPQPSKGGQPGRQAPRAADGRRPARQAPPRQPRQNAPPPRQGAAAQRGQAPRRQGAQRPAHSPPSRAQGTQSQRASRKQAEKRRSAKRGKGPTRGSGYTRKRVRRGQRAVVITILLLAVFGVSVFGVYNGIIKTIDGTRGEQGELPSEIQTLPVWKDAGIVNFLVCGLDYDDESASGYASKEKVGRTDMILYVHYDTDANKASILQLPRDIYVGDKAATGGSGKINGLYFHSQDTNNRMAALANVINEQFRLPVDFYVTIDLDAVKDLIDNATGPIQVYVPAEVNNPETGDVMSAGWHWLTGADAEYLLRNRYSTTYQGQGDVARLQTQQYFYSALYREFTQLAPTDLLMWMKVLLYRVKTDMTDVGKLGGLAQSALSLQGSDITFVRPAVSGAYHNGHSLLSLVDDEFADLLNEYFRPDGESYTVEQLDIKTLYVVDTMGINETSIRTMGDIQESEAPQ